MSDHKFPWLPLPVDLEQFHKEAKKRADKALADFLATGKIPGIAPDEGEPVEPAAFKPTDGLLIGDLLKERGGTFVAWHGVPQRFAAWPKDVHKLHSPGGWPAPEGSEPVVLGDKYVDSDNVKRSPFRFIGRYYAKDLATADCLRELERTTTPSKLVAVAGGNKWVARRAIELYNRGVSASDFSYLVFCNWDERVRGALDMSNFRLTAPTQLQ